MDLFENLSDNQIEAVKTIDEDLEIIACAGAGKTGVVSRRIINILKSNPDILPENIVAFTFTEKAAEELKSRVYKYGEAVLGNTKGFANMYIGTIHNVSRDIRDAASNIRKNDLSRKCSKEKCQKCYLNYLCLSKKEKQEYEV